MILISLSSKIILMSYFWAARAVAWNTVHKCIYLRGFCYDFFTYTVYLIFFPVGPFYLRTTFYGKQNNFHKVTYARYNNTNAFLWFFQVEIKSYIVLYIWWSLVMKMLMFPIIVKPKILSPLYNNKGRLVLPKINLFIWFQYYSFSCI